MHVSDVLLECAKECARLSRECRDEQIAAALFEISARLLATATYDAELVMDEAEAAPQRAAQNGPQSQGSNLPDPKFLAGARR
jgi:hypothetical protein